MSKNIWISSDWHFGHANIIKYANRPFSSVEEMDEIMIARHNALVKPHDKFYCLGDIAFRREVMERILPRLNGKKRLILGNHDLEDMSFYGRYFEKVMGWRQLKEGGVFMVLSHVPLHKQGFDYRDDRPAVNVHGHIHDKRIDDPTYINACMEWTDYGPRNLDSLIKQARKNKGL